MKEVEVEELVYKKDNWMFRIHHRYGSQLPTGLCPLFWSAVGLWVKYFVDLLLKVGIVGAYVGTMVYAIYRWIAYWFFDVDFVFNEDNAATFGTMFIAFTLFIGAFVGYVTHKQKIFSYLPKWMTQKTVKEKKAPSALVAYIKARHRKMCPPVRFED